MLKGVYFMGWYRDMWNYHPSLPMKYYQNVVDISEMHGNMLIWSSLGSGAIGLPYMDLEANAPTPPRMRLYGFMNDREFCEECKKRDIRVFSVLWKAQLWEFGAEFNEDETELLSLNILRGASKNRKYVGMSELSTNKYPHIFDPIEKYFPDGLLDYKGRKVGDFLEEFKSTSLEGRDILSKWLMAPGHDHKCYSPCANKKSYRTYLKKDVEMMIDAGAGGLHIDEYDTQKHVLSNAGCFCDECMYKFNDYLKTKGIPFPEDAGEGEFNYRKYLLKKGYKDENLLAFNTNDRWEIPLYRHFVEMSMEGIESLVGELCAHAKAYAKNKWGKDFPVTANLFQCLPIGFGCKKHLDLLAGEKTDIKLRQDGWYKFAFGWLNGKDCCFVEDPNQYVRDMLCDVKDGINDRSILFLLEPLAHGFHMAFPYGSWLQNQVKDALWLDMRMLKKLGPWLDENEVYFSKKPVADIAVIYDHNSAYEDMWTVPPTQNSTTVYNQIVREDVSKLEYLGGQSGFAGDGSFENFFNLIQKMSDNHILYNVIYESPDERLSMDWLFGYTTLVIPDAVLMDDKTKEVVETFRDNGGEVITFAGKPKGLFASAEFRVGEDDRLIDYLLSKPQAVRARGKGDFGFALCDMGDSYALHIVNYNFNEKTHRIDNIGKLIFEAKGETSLCDLACFPDNPDLSVDVKNKTIEAKNLGIYTIIKLSKF